MSNAADIEAQAAAWVARTDARGGDPDPELAAWLIADPRHRAAYLRLAQAWERTQRLARLRPAGRSIDPDLLAPTRAFHPWSHRRRPPTGPARNSGRFEPARRIRPLRAGALRPAAMAAGLAAAVILTAWNLLPALSTQSYRTGPGGLSRIVLADGSVVTMNADTELRVHFTAARRDLTLLRGEAHFSVTHDIHRPFEVHARDRIVVAVGTAFDVRLASGHGVEVTVTEGRVALLGDGGPHRRRRELSLQTISAGQDALLTTRDVTVQPIDSAEIFRRLAWERRELSFDGQTLREAVAEFGRYTNRRIVIDDPSIASLEMGGSFRALDVVSFTAALGRAFGIDSRISGDGTIHLYRAGGR
ncbi:MAG TPA: FecR domain-containing protein [Steroidobacteraceae bacterium]|jgi:transmembrane sensor|nr:FecR domain-containing protein [Steroidobacteraceae bacterium]